MTSEEFTSEVQARRSLFVRHWPRESKFLYLGPQAYVAFERECREKCIYNTDARYPGNPPQYMDMEVRWMESEGIRVEGEMKEISELQLMTRKDLARCLRMRTDDAYLREAVARILEFVPITKSLGCFR